MTPPYADLAATLYLDDVPGARIPASRLRGILERISERKPLTFLQEDFLRQQGHDSHLAFARGAIDPDEFRTRATQERDIRALKKEAEANRKAAEKAAEDARAAEISAKRNAVFFAERERQMARRKNQRALPDKFRLPFIDYKDRSRVDRILRSVDGGELIGKKDLAWLVTDGKKYWTEKLRQAHHRILAERLSNDWRRKSDAWCAVNACGHWRKAESPTEGLDVAKAALARKLAPKTRSALLTTGGGALRDLRRYTEAVSYGEDAHALTPQDFRPCTLLGAVHIETGAYAKGAEWYEKAEKRGASRAAIDHELQSILAAVPAEQRSFIRQALKAYDVARYGRI